MKKVMMIFGATALLASCNQGGSVDKHAKLTTELDSASYSLGMLIGSDMAKNGDKEEKLNQELVFSGLAAGFDQDSTATLSREEAMKVWQTYMQKQQQKKMQKAQEELAANKEASAKFLEENKAKEGVVTTDSGLQYIIEKKGEGKVAKVGDRVSVHYTGKLVDGTQFDTSLKGENKPFEFEVGKGRVIKGWDEAFQKMPVGSKWKLFIPSELAYGDRAIPKIPAGSVLVFDVELLNINPTAKK